MPFFAVKGVRLYSIVELGMLRGEHRFEGAAGKRAYTEEIPGHTPPKSVSRTILSLHVATGGLHT